MEITTKRPVESPTPDQAATGRPRKRVKIAVRKHKSHYGSLGVRTRGFASTLAKDLYTLPSEILMAQATK
ncbi:hypothetical protein BHE74_00043252 [Ensete ventricosum]|nr:hypothetical protein BHE74_00043252 [Ensete ventricosum]